MGASWSEQRVRLGPNSDQAIRDLASANTNNTVAILYTCNRMSTSQVRIHLKWSFRSSLYEGIFWYNGKQSVNTKENRQYK